MRPLLVSFLLALFVRSYAAEVYQPEATGVSDGLASAQSNTNAIQRLLLDPLKVTRIPIATDRLTTLRFPSPPTDLASALVATEPHPTALFLLSFLPGESFFSLRALSPGVSTTLNVVWKSQTFVLELVESRTPWLSVIFAVPEAPKPVRLSPPTPAPERKPGSQFLETARAYAALKRKYPNSLPDVQLLNLNLKKELGSFSFRTDQLYHFQSDGILVLRMVISNKTSVPLHFGTNALGLWVNGKPFPILLTDFEGTVPGGAELVTYIVFNRNSSPGGKSTLLSDTFGVSLSDPTGSVPLLSEPKPTVVIQSVPPVTGPSPRSGTPRGVPRSRF